MDKTFLLGRQQRVIVNGKSSEWQLVKSGVPQGSVLGPILFLLYINELPNNIVQSKAYLFADDTKLYKAIYKHSDTDELQTDIDILASWSDKQLMKFNLDKCSSMRIGKSSVPERQYHINTHDIKNVDQEKDLGVIIDNNLSFQAHNF